MSYIALFVETFEWTGRQYRFSNSGNVEVLDSVDES